MNKKEEKIKNKIVKLHNRLHKMKNKPSKISMFAFIPVAVVLGFLLSLLTNIVYIPIVSAALIILSSVGITFGLVYNFSKDFHEDRLAKVEEALIKLENQLCDKYAFNKEGNILCVPEGKAEDYVNGKYVLPQNYQVFIKNETTFFTKEEIEDFRSKGYEFCKQDAILRVLDPKEVSICKQKGYTFEKDPKTIASLVVKDGKVINDFKYSVLGLHPIYNVKLTKKEAENKQRIIEKMIANYNKQSKEPIKADEKVEFIEDCKLFGE